MKTRTQVTADKLRGGFYTPDALVDHCLSRVAELVGDRAGLRLVEPSAGDGAFVRGLARSTSLRARVSGIVGVELLDIEAEKARRSLAQTDIAGEIRHGSAVAWSAASAERFDVAVGNPPFVRYQFVSREDREAALALAARLGIDLAGVSNLWIPVLLGALSRVRAGGAFAFVVPTECFTGVSAGRVRAWLLRHCDALRFDHFPPGSFPEVLQEVGVLSGVRAEPSAHATLALVEHDAAGREIAVARHRVAAAEASWTRYLLAPEALDVLAALTVEPTAVALEEVATFEVSIVTGANDFFSVDEATAASQGLRPWAVPLLPRIRHAPGLVLTEDDYAAAARAGARTLLLDFSAERADPTASPGPAAYLRSGEAQALHTRYKCRIREPWFRVPGVRRGALLLSKRSHAYPRVVVNAAGCFTTDTIYRGRARCSSLPAEAIGAAFHNSLTLLSAELEGRSFGGGVLELVPSEIARLAFPARASDMGGELPELDALARRGDPEALVARTDALLAARAGLDRDALRVLSDARLLLRDRRFERNRRVPVRGVDPGSAGAPARGVPVAARAA